MLLIPYLIHVCMEGVVELSTKPNKNKNKNKGKKILVYRGRTHVLAMKRRCPRQAGVFSLNWFQSMLRIHMVLCF